LANKGYDSSYGARPLKRIIQREIENILANKILQGKINDGDLIKISYANDTLKFNNEI
jgi:ATP-dependent Clp protease ATP-binding subunit ClpB